jgi:phospholipid transport system substrate-binding protein
MLNRRILILSLSLLALNGWVWSSAQAQTAPPIADAKAFVQTLGKEAIATMADKSLDKTRRLEKFRILLHKGFDIPTIGRFVLGRYWNAASPSQQQAYMVQLEELVVRSYAVRFDSYNGETFRIAAARVEGDRDVFVSTEINQPGAPPFNVEWRVRLRDSRPAIIDVVVEGVSMSVTQRQEFASVLQAKGGNFDAFLQALKEKNATLAAAGP